MSANPSFVATIKNVGVAFVNADGATFKTLCAAGALGSRVDAVFATNNDTVNARTLLVSVQISGVDYPLGAVLVPAGAGVSAGIKSVSVLDVANLPGLANSEGLSLFLATGAVLRGSVLGGVSGSNTVSVMAMAGDY